MVDDATMYVRATPARTQQDEDWYVSVVRDYVARDDRWTSAWDMSVYIFAMFRDADRNLD
jgi:hypothetical protein